MRLFSTCAVTAMTMLWASAALACPFCEAPSLTLTEQLNQADVAVLAQWVSLEEADRDEGLPGSTTFEIVDIVHDSTAGLDRGERIDLARARAAKPGDLFLLLGTQSTDVEWSSPLEVSETSYQYMRQAPTKESNPTERLAYFLQFLEYPDPLIANDAYAEFANAPYEDIVPLASEMEPEKIRRWLTDPRTTPTRLGLYGLMLGLSGDAEDAALMRAKIVEQTEDFRLGIDGIMAGYLLLTGEEGLAVIEDTKLRNTKVPFSETYAAMQALRFMWTYAEGVIPKERLRASMRILLDRPELADLVITDLARWQDWTVMDRMMELYGAEEYNIPSIKRAIVRYFLVAKRATSEDPSADNAHVARAEEYLAQLRESDPETVQAAERFFFLN